MFNFVKQNCVPLLVASAVVIALATLPAAQQPPALNSVPDPDAAVMMRLKLVSTQKVVEGLMSGDFAAIRQGGEDLGKVCDSLTWRRRDNEVVSHYRGELHRSALKLVKLSDEENLQGAAYAYMHTMTTCINCHEYSRNVLRIAANPAAQDGVVPIPVTAQSPRERTVLLR